MPNPFEVRDRTKLERGYAVLAKRPHCATKIAQIAAAAAELEGTLAQIVGFATTLERDEIQGAPFFPANGPMLAAMAALETWRQRFEAAEAALALTISEELLKEFQRVRKRIDSGPIKRRNQILHTEWAIIVGRDEDLLAGPRPDGTYVLWTPRCFDDVLAAFAAEEVNLQRLGIRAVIQRGRALADKNVRT